MWRCIGKPIQKYIMTEKVKQRQTREQQRKAEQNQNQELANNL
jgi:hypothetical protein